MKARILVFMLFPMICGLLSTLLFVLQGGFGGGHGRYDFSIGILGLPWVGVDVAFGPDLPWPAFIRDHDLLSKIWFPALMNMVLFGLAGYISWLLLPCSKGHPTERRAGARLPDSGL
jgi:hypothetical protein